MALVLFVEYNLHDVNSSVCWFGVCKGEFFPLDPPILFTGVKSQRQHAQICLFRQAQLYFRSLFIHPLTWKPSRFLLHSSYKPTANWRYLCSCSAVKQMLCYLLREKSLPELSFHFTVVSCNMTCFATSAVCCWDVTLKVYLFFHFQSNLRQWPKDIRQERKSIKIWYNKE